MAAQKIEKGEIVKIVNLTPHTVHLPDRSIEPSGIVARCQENTTFVGTFDGITLIMRYYGDVTDLPDSESGTLYIVSMLVRQASPGRDDVASPGDLLRDVSGQIVGALNLVVNY